MRDSRLGPMANVTEALRKSVDPGLEPSSFGGVARESEAEHQNDSTL